LEGGVHHRDIVAIGTSAGGIQALRFLMRNLPADLDAALLIVIHLTEGFPSVLDRILSGDGRLPVRFAQEGDRVKRRHVSLARPDCHLLLDGDRLQLGRGPRENNARPAIDPLFRSVAQCCGARAIGVVLSGMLGDGAAGLVALKQCGAITVVQEPSDAAFPEMPATALQRAKPDHIAELAAIPALLQQLVQQPPGNSVPPSNRLRFEVEIARSGRANMGDMDRVGRRSVLTCPDCHGVMWEIEEGDLVRYRCHVGHAYTAETMRHAVDENLTRALASALRALDERIAITQKLRDKAAESGHNNSVDWWQSRVDETEREAEIIRQSIMRMEELATADRDGT
jgi:two-component system, chemotaxis family, protein-glutamate methylesterase/glutaminase